MSWMLILETYKYKKQLIMLENTEVQQSLMFSVWETTIFIIWSDEFLHSLLIFKKKGPQLLKGE